MNLFPASSGHEPRRALVSHLGAPLRTVVVGKKQEFPVCPVDPLAFSGSGDWGSPLLRTPPPGLAASLAPRNGRAHSWGSAERVLIRRPLLPTFQLREKGWGMGQAGRQTDRLSDRAYDWSKVHGNTQHQSFVHGLRPQGLPVSRHVGSPVPFLSEPGLLSSVKFWVGLNK